MNKPIRFFIDALLTTILVAGTQTVLANGANLLKDPDFELQLPPEQGGWILFDESTRSQREARSGKESMHNWGFSRTIPSPPFLLGTVSGSYQEFDAASGSRWRMSGFGKTPNPIRGAPAFGVLQISFFDANGNDLGTIETSGSEKPRAKTSNQINSGSPAGEWIFLDTGIVTAPENTAKIHAFTLFVDFSGSGVSQGVYFDDLMLCPVDQDGNPDCR